MAVVESAESAAHHADGLPCPDDHGEGPCDGSCPCVCCPGHLNLLHPPSAAAVRHPTPTATPKLLAPEPEDVLSVGVAGRVFRPPRP